MAIGNNYSESYAKFSRNDKLNVGMPLRDKVLFGIINETACTVSELVKIKVEDIGIELTIGNRKSPISKELYNNLVKYLNGRHGYVFKTRQSQHMDERRAQQILKKYNCTPTNLRHKAIRKIAKVKSADYAKSMAGLKHLRNKATLSRNELKKIRKTITSDRDSLVFEILYETGCKLTELVEIKTKDLKGRHLLTGNRQIELSSKLLKKLKTFATGRHGYLFESRQRSRISEKRVFQILNKISKESDVAMNQRILRNTRIELLLSKGKDELQRQLGITADFASYGLMHE